MNLDHNSEYTRPHWDCYEIIGKFFNAQSIFKLHSQSDRFLINFDFCNESTHSYAWP